MEDFFSDLTANRPYIHLVKEEGQEGFTGQAHLRHDISFGEEGALIRQAGAYRALYFCPGADRFAIEKNGAVVPYAQFRREGRGSWGLAVFEVTLGELPRAGALGSGARRRRAGRKKAILNLMRDSGRLLRREKGDKMETQHKRGGTHMRILRVPLDARKGLRGSAISVRWSPKALLS